MNILERLKALFKSKKSPKSKPTDSQSPEPLQSDVISNVMGEDPIKDDEADQDETESAQVLQSEDSEGHRLVKESDEDYLSDSDVADSLRGEDSEGNRIVE